MLINSNVATVELTDSVETVEFSAAYAYYWLSNQSDGVMYASIGEPVPEAEGTYTINPGCDVRIPGGMSYGKINVIGTGKLMVYASNIAECPINSASSGLSDEDTVKTVNGISPDENGNVDIDTKNIDNIPVDLTGIYNNQVIGYDETQGKLVPMNAVARTQTILPNTEDPRPWTISNLVNCTVRESDLYATAQSTGDYSFAFTIDKPYMLSEFTNFRISQASNYRNNSCFTKITFSKKSDFSEPDAVFNFQYTGTADITALRGSYYIKIELNLVGSQDNSAYGITSMYLD